MLEFVIYHENKEYLGNKGVIPYQCRYCPAEQDPAKPWRSGI